MMMNVHIVRKTVIGVFLLMALMAEAVPAQNYATGLASAPSPISGGSAINSGASGTSTPLRNTKSPVGSAACVPKRS
jgi:hypothetical protein